MDRRQFLVATASHAALAVASSAPGAAMANPPDQDALARRLVQLPPAFERYSEIHGALDFAVFSDVDGREDLVLAAIANAIPNVNPAKLKALGSRRISDEAFFGDWYDAATGDLLCLGTHTTQDGQKLVNPRLRDLRDHCGGIEIPEPGGGGQFAYAFSWTPYGLQAHPLEIQQLFQAITDFVLPPGADHEIWDWASPRLPEVSQYFEAGMEWWGVFLFTIYVPSLRRLTIIAGSTTD